MPKSPPYYYGRFSNGITWAEVVGNYYHKNYQMDYEIFAVGGATAIYHRPTKEFVAPTLLKFEMAQYQIENLFKDKSKTLFAFWVGANDYLYDRNPNYNALTANIVGKIIFEMETLIKAGARYFLILNMPDLARTPTLNPGKELERLHVTSVMHNAKLAEALQQLRQIHPEITITTIDIFNFFNDALDNTAKWNEKYHINIQETKLSCWRGGYTFAKTGPLNEAARIANLYAAGYRACEHPDEYIFWDHVHPTAIVHQILGQLVIEALGS